MRFLPILSAIAMAATSATAQPRQEETSSRVSYVAPKPKPRPVDSRASAESAPLQNQRS